MRTDTTTQHATTETVCVADADQAMRVLDTWRRGDLGMVTRHRDKAELRRLFELTGVLRMRAWQTTSSGCAERHRELVELVIRRRDA